MRLNVAGIKLEPLKSDAIVYHPNDGYPNRWLFAKLHVSNTDHQYHEFVRHLGWAHLFAEPLSIARHNAFWDLPEHPIGKMLKPHYVGTIGINYMARQTLVDQKYPFTQSTFSVGSVGGMLLFGLWARDVKLMDLTHPRDMETRGFDREGTDGLTEFYFRDDGYKNYDLMHEYVKGVVDLTYKTDEEVTADPAIVRYYDELSNPEKARVRGIPAKPSTKKHLTDLLMSVIYPATFVHSTVNYAQKDYTAYVPARPDSMNSLMPEWAAVEKPEKDLDMEFINLALPNIFKNHFQILFGFLLGTTKSHAYLTNFKNVFDSNNEGPYEALRVEYQKKLKELSSEIKERNAKLRKDGKAWYPYLDPEEVAVSINI